MMHSFQMMYDILLAKVDRLAVREDFLSKSAWKSPILAARFLDHLTLERASTHNFKDWDLFRMCFGKFGTWAFRWAMGRPSSIKIVRLAAIWNFFGAAMENCRKRRFYRTQVSLGSDLWVRSLSLSPRPFWNLTDVTLADGDTKPILTDKCQ